tara:strand:- start:40 stop:1185 length:1146 start_codon:yes stop_codon:yes gene_type:complete
MSYLYHNKGVYHCNGKPFLNKLEAILEANTSGLHVEWDYHNSIFGQSSWDIEPNIELRELYRQRALQLRESYDHLVLFYSGGVDSWTILKTFIDNNIRVDEIYMFGAFDIEEKQYSRWRKSTTPGYYSREIKQSLPMIKKLAESHKIKVNLYDWTQDIIDAANDPDWFWTAAVRFDPSCMVRSKFHKIFREHNELLHKGKKVGFVYGIDKPRLLRDDNNIYFAFLDIIMTTGTLPTNDILGENWENDEYFYWTPNLPELSIKQSHAVVNWLRVNNKLHYIRHVNNAVDFHDEEYYREVNLSIYPDWDNNIWQIKKPTGAIYNENARWFIEGKFEAKLKWENSLWELERVCGKKWFNNHTVNDGLRGHLSPLYKITNYQRNV